MRSRSRYSRCVYVVRSGPATGVASASVIRAGVPGSARPTRGSSSWCVAWECSWKTESGARRVVVVGPVARADAVEDDAVPGIERAVAARLHADRDLAHGLSRAPRPLGSVSMRDCVEAALRVQPQRRRIDARVARLTPVALRSEPVTAYMPRSVTESFTQPAARENQDPDAPAARLHGKTLWFTTSFFTSGIRRGRIGNGGGRRVVDHDVRRRRVGRESAP